MLAWLGCQSQEKAKKTTANPKKILRKSKKTIGWRVPSKQPIVVAFFFLARGLVRGFDRMARGSVVV